MLKYIGNSNLECAQYAMPGRKSLLACALLAMLAGNQAMADVTIDDSNSPVTTDGSSISVDNGQGDLTLIEAGSVIISDQNNNLVVINPGSGIAVTTEGAGTSVITSDGTGSNIYGDLTVQGNIGTAGEPVGTVNSANIVNSGSVKSGSVSATTINGDTITGALNASGSAVSNVGDGVADSDAVNVRQLNSMRDASSAALNNFANEVDSRFSAVDRRIDKVEEVANAGVASVAALAAIPAPAYGKRFSVGAGLGNYASESAVAVGFRAAITESTSVTAGVSRNSASKTAANLGVGYSW